MVNNLKNILLGVLLVLVAQKGSAQENKDADDFNTVFKKSSFKKLKGYGGPLVEYSRFIGQNAFFVGGKGGFVLQDKWGVGLLLKGKTSRNNFNAEHNSYGKQEYMKISSISSGFGGVFVEYICDLNKTVHCNFFSNFLVGRSAVSIKEETIDKDGDKDTKSKRIARANMIGIEPGVGVEVNISKNFIVNLHLAYRYIASKKTLLHFDNTDFSGVSFGIDFKFGKF